jgi:hypothetical protein
VRAPILAMLEPAATVRKRRRVGSIADVFVGGVLYTLSAWIIGFPAEVPASPRLAFVLYRKYEESKNC